MKLKTLLKDLPWVMLIGGLVLSLNAPVAIASSDKLGSGLAIDLEGGPCIKNSMTGLYLGSHENGQLVSWKNCSGGGEKWQYQNNCLRNSLTGKYLGSHANGELVSWPSCSGAGERWRRTQSGCFINELTGLHLGSHPNGQLVSWHSCGQGEKWMFTN